MESLALDSEQRAALITGIKAAIADQTKALLTTSPSSAGASKRLSRGSPALAAAAASAY